MRSPHKPAGFYWITGDGKPIEGETRRCVHCGGHWQVSDTSGRKERHEMKLRGWCGNCRGFICGPKCLECVPAEKKLEIREGSVQPGTVKVAPGYVGRGRLLVPSHLGK